MKATTVFARPPERPGAHISFFDYFSERFLNEL